LVGQSYRGKEDQVFTGGTGLDDNVSDYVGRVIHTIDRDFYTNFRFRVDKDNLAFKRSELGFIMDLDWAQFNTDYTFIDGIAGAVDRQEVNASTYFKINDQWAFLAEGRRNLDNDNNSGWVFVSSGVEYTDDCITTTVEINREFTRDRDIEPTTNLLFKISLKNLGS
jgi:LPS-assembly protein